MGFIGWFVRRKTQESTPLTFGPDPRLLTFFSLGSLSSLQRRRTSSSPSSPATPSARCSAPRAPSTCRPASCRCRPTPPWSSTRSTTCCWGCWDAPSCTWTPAFTAPPSWSSTSASWPTASSPRRRSSCSLDTSWTSGTCSRYVLRVLFHVSLFPSRWHIFPPWMIWSWVSSSLSAAQTVRAGDRHQPQQAGAALLLVQHVCGLSRERPAGGAEPGGDEEHRLQLHPGWSRRPGGGAVQPRHAAGLLRHPAHVLRAVARLHPPARLAPEHPVGLQEPDATRQPVPRGGWRVCVTHDVVCFDWLSLLAC